VPVSVELSDTAGALDFTACEACRTSAGDSRYDELRASGGVSHPCSMRSR